MCAQIVEFDRTEIDLLKLVCEGAEYTIFESLSAHDQLPQVGWIRDAWHGRRLTPRLLDALAATHVNHVDPHPPQECGLFIAHRR